MAEQQNFRTAFNGFNRDDVVHYIEKLNAKHAAEVNKLNSDLQYLQEKLDAAESQCAMSAPAAVIPAKSSSASDAAIRALEQELALAREAARSAEAQLLDQMTENKRLQGLLDAALARQSEARTRQEAELDTYRRAERVEREARGRAGVIYEQVAGALSDATVRVEETADQIAALSDISMKHLKQLQLAISGSKQILRDTAVSIGSIRPEDEEE